MKAATLVLVGGLVFAGASLASEPAPQQTTTPSASLKIGIDPITGKRRQLTAEESAALDAQAAAMSRTAAKASSARAKTAGLATPATFAESAASGVSKGGVTGYIAPLESYSHITITRDANGKIVMMEDGVPMQQEREMASE